MSKGLGKQEELNECLLTNNSNKTSDDETNMVCYKPKVDTPFFDWNEFDLSKMVEYLKNKYLINSSGEALCIHKLIEFYENNKNK